MLRSAAVVVVGLLLLCLTGAVAAADAPARPVQVDALAASGPPLHTSAAALAASLSCAGDVSGSPLTPVLLVHGTGSTPQGSWGPIYLPLFAAEGRPACTVALPARATGDEQVAVEYVVSAIRSMSAARHGRIDVVGHSQGAFLPVLALEFWPDLAGDVEDYVGLAPTLTVGTTGEVICAMACTAPFQQRRASSAFFSGFLAHPLPAGPSYTTIATLTDEVATPEPATSHLDGAENVVLQQVCPAKVVDHFALLSDGTVHDLVLDALTHAGPTGPTRLPVTACADALRQGSTPPPSPRCWPRPWPTTWSPTARRRSSPPSRRCAATWRPAAPTSTTAAGCSALRASRAAASTWLDRLPAPSPRCCGGRPARPAR